MPTSYHIIQRNTFNIITESSGTVIDASTALDWSIGLPLSFVRQYVERKGWQIVPVIERDTEQRVIELDGVTYTFVHDGLNIKRIMKDNREISWTDVPVVLKGLFR